MPKYSNAKKQEALAMLETKTIEEVSAELHIRAHTLQRWQSGGKANEKDEPEKVAPKRGRRDAAGEPKKDALALAREMLAEDGDNQRQRLRDLEEENAKLRAETVALREKCEEYHAVVEALVAMIH